MPASVWLTARQRDFTGGENLSLLPEKVGRNQFIRMENAIISPQGEVTAPWQMDEELFVNVASGIVLAPISGSRLYTVYAKAAGGVIQFTVDPQSATPYDMSNAAGYPGYVFHAHVSPVSILGISHGTPFLGKYYCCASTSLYITGGELTAASLSFGTVQTVRTAQLSVTVTNMTASPVTLQAASFSGANAARFSHVGVFPHALAPSGSYTFAVTYAPVAPSGTDAASLNVTANIGILQIPVSGISSTAKVDLVPSVAAALAYTNAVQADFMSRTVTAINRMVVGTDPNPYGYTIADSTVRNSIANGTYTLADVLANPGAYGGAMAASYSAYLAIKAEYDAL